MRREHRAPAAQQEFSPVHWRRSCVPCARVWGNCSRSSIAQQNQIDAGVTNYWLFINHDGSEPREPKPEFLKVKNKMVTTMSAATTNVTATTVARKLVS